MQIKNPTKDTLEVTVKGVAYSIEPEGTLNNIPEEHARYWQENLHKFIQIKKDKLEDLPVEETVEIPQPKVEEVKQEVSEAYEAPVETGLAMTEETPIVEEEKVEAKPSKNKKAK